MQWPRIQQNPQKTPHGSMVVVAVAVVAAIKEAKSCTDPQISSLSGSLRRREKQKRRDESGGKEIAGRQATKYRGEAQERVIG